MEEAASPSVSPDVSRRARKRKSLQAILGVKPDWPIVARHLRIGRLAPHWLPNWHPTSGLDVTLDVVGNDVDDRCHRMPVVTEHHSGIHMT